MRRLLLVSTSTTFGTGYLEHCADQARRLFANARDLAFVPYAAHDLDSYADLAAGAFERWGFELTSLHAAESPSAAIEAADGLFIGGGNTFRLVRALQRHELIEPIRKRVAVGMPYMGTSAGSNVACPTLCTTNDMPIVEPESFDALGLVPFQINPHYLDPDPSSRHMGESRDQRLAEYHEENERPIVALREGAMLSIRGRTMTLLGDPGGRLFRRGEETLDLTAGADLSDLL